MGVTFVAYNLLPERVKDEVFMPGRYGQDKDIWPELLNSEVVWDTIRLNEYYYSRPRYPSKAAYFVEHLYEEEQIDEYTRNRWYNLFQHMLKDDSIWLEAIY